MALTDSYLRSVLGKDSDGVFEKSDRDGLSARISRKGKVVFQIRYMLAGKQRRLDIGTYPGMSLKEARDENIKLRRVLEEGQNPSEYLANRILERQTAMSVEDVVREWIRVYASANVKGHSQILRSFELHVFPTIGKMKHDSVNQHVWLRLIEGVQKESPSIARRLLSTGSQIHSWGVRRGDITTKPLEGISAQDMGIKRGVTTRVLDDDEIRLVFDALKLSKMTEKNKILVKLVILFGCRSGEIISSKVKHFDFVKNVWTVPPENHKGGKTGKSILRPIIPAAKELIKEAMRLNGGSDYLFERAFNEPRISRPMDSSAALSLPKTIIAWTYRHKGILMPHWTMHDLRRTARTRWSTLAAPHVCEVMLGHKLPGIWSVYDHNDYMEEQRKAYQAWDDELVGILAG